MASIHSTFQTLSQANSVSLITWLWAWWLWFDSEWG